MGASQCSVWAEGRGPATISLTPQPYAAASVVDRPMHSPSHTSLPAGLDIHTHNHANRTHRGHAPAAHLRLRGVECRGRGHKVARHCQTAVALRQQAPYLGGKAGLVLEGGGSAESCAELSSPMLLTPIPKPCWPTMQSLKACFLTTAHLPNRVLARQQHNAQHSPSFQSLPHSCHSHPC